jgi:hypothetical protein
MVTLRPVCFSMYSWIGAPYASSFSPYSASSANSSNSPSLSPFSVVVDEIGA